VARDDTLADVYDGSHRRLGVPRGEILGIARIILH
jgi:hypothetical protein